MVGCERWGVLGVSVRVRCGRQEEAGSGGAREDQGVMGTERSQLEGLNRALRETIGGVWVWAGWRGEMQHGIDSAWDKNEVGHIMLDEAEIIPPPQMRNILKASCCDII